MSREFLQRMQREFTPTERPSIYQWIRHQQLLLISWTERVNFLKTVKLRQLTSLVPSWNTFSAHLFPRSFQGASSDWLEMVGSFSSKMDPNERSIFVYVLGWNIENVSAVDPFDPVRMIGEGSTNTGAEQRKVCVNNLREISVDLIIDLIITIISKPFKALPLDTADLRSTGWRAHWIKASRQYLLGIPSYIYQVLTRYPVDTPIEWFFA